MRRGGGAGEWRGKKTLPRSRAEQRGREKRKKRKAPLVIGDLHANDPQSDIQMTDVKRILYRADWPTEEP